MCIGNNPNMIFLLGEKTDFLRQTRYFEELVYVDEYN